MAFKPGQSGNPKGRPKGSKNRMAEYFVLALAEDFEKHGVSVIEKVRGDHPCEYLKICARMVPKEINTTESLVSSQMLTDEELERIAAGGGG